MTYPSSCSLPPERNTDRTGRNGIITEYEIQHRVPSSGDDFSITTVDGSVTHVLLLGTQLEVKIACSTNKGQGPFTAARVFDGSGGEAGDHQLACP